MAFIAAKISWLCILLRDLRVYLYQVPLIWFDNLSAISLASNLVLHVRTKHIEIDYHYVHEKVLQKELDVRFITTKDQVADIFTKGLSTQRFQFL